MVGLLRVIGQREEEPGLSGRLGGVPDALDRGDLGLLQEVVVTPERVAEGDHGERGDQAIEGGHAEGAGGEGAMAALEEVEGADAHHEHRCRNESGDRGVHEFRLGVLAEDEGREIVEFEPHRVGIEARPRRVLHEGVGDEDPEGGKVGAQGDEIGHREMGGAAQAVPAEEHQADEGRFHEEGHQSFDGERRAKHIAHEMGIHRPVGAELELHGEPGRHADGEVDAEQLAPELGHLLIDVLAGDDIDRLHRGEEHREAERERHEEEVIERGQRELQTRQINDQ